MNKLLAAAALGIALTGAETPALAKEAFTGVYVHGVDTPFTLKTGEHGADVELGYRFDKAEALHFIGSPAPYVIASVNTQGDTSFAGAGLSWKLGSGPVYARPELGFVVQDGPSNRVTADGQHTELGSRVLFEPGIAVGTQLSPRVGIEASWVHISHARLFNWHQNPGIDMWGARLNLQL